MLARRSTAALGVVALLATAGDRSEAAAQEQAFSQDTLVLDLDTARRIALERSPRIHAARALLDGARGDRRQAGVYTYNPDFQLKMSSLIEPGDLGSFEGLLTQEFEWAGQWGLRKAAADHGILAAQGTALDVVRATVYQVDVSYFRAVVAERRLEVRRLGSELSGGFLEAVEIQAREGDASPMEVNLAQIEAGRARAAERSALRTTSLAKLELARVLGLEPGRPVTLDIQTTTSFREQSFDLDSLVAVAIALRPDLKAAEAEVARANAGRRLVSRQAIPNLRVSAVAERGDLSQDVNWGLRFGLLLPLWNRNQGLADLGRAEESRAEAEREALELLVRTEVASSLETYLSAREELDVFEAQVLNPARSNRGLLQTAYMAGRMDLPTALILQSQLLEAELEYWNAWLAERTALSALRAAVGDVPIELAPEL
ncbi:MAG: TolC family protein [Gemmatimonadota bacterium]|nr:MAG: TolC family protein [Gemmatimonadota bacterium]